MTLSVTLEIPYKQASDLARVISTARSTDESGKMTVYRIVNNTAETCKIREVTFSDNFNATEHDTLNLWQVSFTLAEHKTVPEKTEQRQPQPTATEQTSGSAVTSTQPTPTNSEEQLTGFLAVLKQADDALA